MWKKLLISAVTFVAGLYFFLEYMVPPTIPWHTVVGVMASAPTAKQISLRTYGPTESLPINADTVVVRHFTGSKGIDENVVPLAVKPGDQVTVNGVSGQVADMPTPSKISVTTYGPTTAVALADNSLIFSRSGQTGYSATKWDALKVGDAVKVGPTTYLSQWQTTVNDFLIVLAALAWGMGLISLWMVHSTNIRKRRPEWFLSVFLFMSIIFGVMAGYGFGKESGGWKSLSDVVFQYLLIPMGSTVFSLLTFYMASAAYRSFKAKSSEAVLMMVSALIIMMGQIPVGLWLTKGLPPSVQMPVVSQWILYIANSAAVNGMWFGMMLGAIAVGLRFWLSLERGAFFDQEL